MNKEQSIQKINQMGHVGQVLITIAKLFAFIALFATLAMTIASMALPKNFITAKLSGSAAFDINLGAIGTSLSDKEVADLNSGKSTKDFNAQISTNDVNLTMGDVKANKENIQTTFDLKDFSNPSLHDLVWIGVAGLINIIFVLVTLFYAGFLCKAIRNCQSPFDENVITKMKHLAFSLIPWVVMDSVTNAITSSIFTGKLSISLSLNMGMIFAVLVIFALAYIFQYGAVLQQESDETL